MKICFELEDHEENVTPMKIADALVSDAKLSVTELQELCEYLTTFVNHHSYARGECRRDPSYD